MNTMFPGPEISLINNLVSARGIVFPRTKEIVNMVLEGLVTLYDQFYCMHQYQGPRGRVGGCHSPNVIEISRLGKVPNCCAIENHL